MITADVFSSQKHLSHTYIAQPLQTLIFLKVNISVKAQSFYFLICLKIQLYFPTTASLKRQSVIDSAFYLTDSDIYLFILSKLSFAVCDSLRKAFVR